MSTHVRRRRVACECGYALSEIEGHRHYVEVTSFNTSSVHRIRLFLSNTEHPESAARDESADLEVSEIYLGSEQWGALVELMFPDACRRPVELYAG